MKIKIAGITFEAPVEERFVAGHVCSQNEALALQRTLLENIANNTRADVNDLKIAAFRAINGLPDSVVPKLEDLRTVGESELDPVALANLRTKFAEYASAYEFGVPRARGEVADLDPVEALAFNMILKAVKDHYKAEGYKLADLDPKGLEDTALAQLAIPDVRERYMAAAEETIRAQSRLSGLTLPGMSAPTKRPDQAPAESTESA